jgi:hypothetical protein
VTVVDLEKRRQQNADRQRRYRERHGKVDTGQGFKLRCSLCGDDFWSFDRQVRVCGEGKCKNEKRPARLKPFTVPHFKWWAGHVILDTGDPWKPETFQLDFFRDVFDGVPENWLLIGEGNTKTTSLGGLALYHCEFRRNGRVPVAAASRDQAMEMWLQIDLMVQESEHLRALFVTQEGNRRIKCASMNSRIQVYAADDRTGDGAIFTLALLDELHRHRDLRLYRTWTGKRQKRGGQICAISTAGEPGSEFEETRQKIRTTGTREERRPGYIRAVSGSVVLHDYHVPDGHNVEDMKAVKMANPFSGVTTATLKEKRQSPTMTLPHWTRFTCNRATRGFAAAVTEAEWFRRQADFEIPPGVPVAAGLDIAWKWDTTALVPYWLRDPKFALLGEATVLEPPRNGDMLDPDEVEDALLQLHDRNPIHTLVMDMTKGETLAAWAIEHLGCEVVDRAQSPSLACLDYEHFMEWLRNKEERDGRGSGGQLWHTGDPTLTSHVMNAASKMYPDGKTRFIRPKQSRGTDQGQRVIDALTAASMIHGLTVAELAVDEQEILVALA